ncbi:Kinesin-like protein KIN-7O [Vitis vinifera]|uniref:Kinesin-like protein KIN-7O n=1 Tax=Vitis vinifera TaxID=29760 RepID=A0A438DKP3_VITVI|nr:Kinesin-like protein KIN-7O [Vitis vinifera]
MCCFAGSELEMCDACGLTIEYFYGVCLKIEIHADETKSSLQFASRALRVTNCAHVNEILTDAALLKRQKKEIEELRAKLQGSHSEHFEEEILNLRNTLLKERIALELEEEKKAQVERERRLQEQAKKIENLSSMVLYSNRDENHDHYKKVGLGLTTNSIQPVELQL